LGSLGDALRLGHRGSIRSVESACLIVDELMRKTWIMNGTNLNHVVATKYMKRLLKCGFLTQAEKRAL
jgi:hypothetical protein